MRSRMQQGAHTCQAITGNIPTWSGLDAGASVEEAHHREKGEGEQDELRDAQKPGKAKGGRALVLA